MVNTRMHRQSKTVGNGTWPPPGSFCNQITTTAKEPSGSKQGHQQAILLYQDAQEQYLTYCD